MRRLALLTAAWIAVLPTNARSQTSEDLNKSNPRIIRSVENMLHSLVNHVFIPTIKAQKPEYLRTLRTIRIVVQDDALPEARAYFSRGRRYVEFNTGIGAVTQLYINYAAIRTGLASEHNSRCKTYVDYLAEKIVQMRAVRSQGTYPSRFFWHHVEKPDTFCGVSHLDLDTRIGALSEQIARDTEHAVYALIFGHELGHHILGHLPIKRGETPQQSRLMEAEADRFAARLIGRHMIRAYAAVIFDLLARTRTQHPFAQYATHDPAECRMAYLLSIDQMFFGSATGLNIVKTIVGQRIDIRERIPYLAKFIADIEITTDRTRASKCEIVN